MLHKAVPEQAIHTQHIINDFWEKASQFSSWKRLIATVKFIVAYEYVVYVTHVCICFHCLSGQTPLLHVL